MTVNTTTITSGPYVGTNLTNEFTYDFRITADTELKVFQTAAGAETSTLLVLTTDYTVTGTGAETGTIVLTAGNLETGGKIFIRSNYDVTQLTSFRSQGRFSPEIHEDAFDKLTRVSQQLLEARNRSLQLAEDTTNIEPLTIELPVAGHILRYKSDLSGVEGVPLSSIPEASGAVDLLYTNTGSTLSSSNVNAALDELDAAVVSNTSAVALATALKYDKTGGTLTGPAKSASGDFNLITNTALSDAALTLTAAQLFGGEFTITPTVARVQTLDTAANIISALSGSVDGSHFTFTVVNSAAFDVTIAAAAGVTLIGNMAVNDGSATFRVRRLTSSTVSVTRLEGGVGIPIIFTREYESAPQTVTTAGLLTLTHGLGREPRLCDFYLVCTIAQAGYSVGDKLIADLGSTRYNTPMFTSTQIFIRFSNATSSSFVVSHKSTGAASGITNSRWKMVVRAYA